MIRKLALLVAAAMLVLPAAALAAKPPHPTQAQNTTKPAQAQGKAAPKVMYVLRGTVTAYTAAAGDTNGSVSLNVSGANHHAAALKTQTLTFPVSSTTKVVLHNAAPIAAGDKAILKVRGPKKLDATALQAMVARQLIDQGAPQSD